MFSDACVWWGRFTEMPFFLVFASGISDINILSNEKEIAKRRKELSISLYVSLSTYHLSTHPFIHPSL